MFISDTHHLAGLYTLAISAFEPEMQTQFSLTIESTGVVDAAPISSEGAGVFTKNVKAVW